MNYCINCGNKIKSARCKKCGYNYKRGRLEQSNKEIFQSFLCCVVIFVLEFITYRLFYSGNNTLKILTPLGLIAVSFAVVKARQNFPRSYFIRVVYYLFLTELLLYIIFLSYIFVLYLTCVGLT